MSYGDANEHDGQLTTRAEPIVFCPVACIDFVDYSRRSVAEQMRLRAQLNDLLVRALAGIGAGERIILDSSEGVAVIFLCAPEQCLFFGVALRDALAPRSDDALRLRIGLNVGPVRMLHGDSSGPKFIGDALVVGKRITLFSGVNQVVVSRSFYEAVSPQYAHCFAFEGARTDSHVREHQVYSLRAGPASIRSPGELPHDTDTDAGAALGTIRAEGLAARAQVLGRPPLATALVVALILGAAIVLRPGSEKALVATHVATHIEGTRTEAPVSGVPPIQDAPVAPPAGTSLAEPAGHPPLPEPPPVPLLGPSVGPATAMSAAAPPRSPASSAEPPKRPQRMSLEAVTSPQPRPNPGEARDSQPQAQSSNQAVATGAVRLTVVPWGEIYLDGEMLGVAPPLRDIALDPGMYRIEIRNPGFASRLQIVEVNAGEEIRIRHRFD